LGCYPQIWGENAFATEHNLSKKNNILK
jgi:hypothetical protein